MIVAYGQRARRLAIGAALPLAVYLLAAAIVTWPLAGHLGDRAAGTGYADTLEVTRHIWWAREALLDSANPSTSACWPTRTASWKRVQWAHPLQGAAGGAAVLVILR